MIRHSIVGFVLFFGVLVASPAEAKCSSDFWGSRTSWITGVGDRTAQIYTKTTLAHSSNHLGCEGTVTSKAILTGDNTACSANPGSKPHPYNGSSLTVSSVQTCGFLSYGVWYNADGHHNGFGEPTFVSHGDGPIRWTAPDADGDGYPAGEDCNDSNFNINPGIQLTCNDLSSQDKNCNGQSDIEEMGPMCANCPLIISLEGNRIHLTNPESGVWFDLNADGETERLSWTLPGSGGAWLALDRNSNGRIDNGLELFSNFAAQPGSTAPNGFAALQMFDANRDGWIDHHDPVFAQLLVWSDRNHDGVSQARELQLLSQVGVTKISLDVKTSKRRDRWGNEFRYWAALTSQGSTDIGRYIVDVFLRVAVTTGTR